MTPNLGQIYKFNGLFFVLRNWKLLELHNVGKMVMLALDRDLPGVI